MDDDVIVIDARNASRILSGLGQGRTPTGRPPVVITQGQAQPAMIVPQSATAGAAVYVRDPATGALVREQAGAAAPTVGAKLGALGAGKMFGIGVQLLALLMPLPTAPGATGDIAKDMRNGQLYTEAAAIAQQRFHKLNVIGQLIAQVV